MKKNKKLMKRKILNISLVLLIIITSTITLYAQDTKVTDDLELWTTIGIKKKISKNWKLSLDQSFRFTEDISRFDIYFTDLGFNYKINKHFKLGANYRFYQNKNNDNNFKTQHRFSADATYKQKIKRFSLAYRIRLQNKDEEFFNTSSSNIYNLRNKFSVDYNIKKFKFDPFLSVELYDRIEDINNNELSKLRSTIGIEYSSKKLGNINVFYRIDNELNQSYNKDTYILGIGYSFSF